MGREATRREISCTLWRRFSRLISTHGSKEESSGVEVSAARASPARAGAVSQSAGSASPVRKNERRDVFMSPPHLRLSGETLAEALKGKKQAWRVFAPETDRACRPRTSPESDATTRPNSRLTLLLTMSPPFREFLISIISPSLLTCIASSKPAWLEAGLAALN